MTAWTNARQLGQRSRGALASARATAGRSSSGIIDRSGSRIMCPAITAAGGTYVSGFYLPRRHCYVEIKPRECRDEPQLHARTILASRAPVLVVDSPRRGEFAAYENFNVVKPGRWTTGPGRHWMPPRVGARRRGRLRWRVLLACLAVAAWFFWPCQPTEPTPTPSAEV